MTHRFTAASLTAITLAALSGCTAASEQAPSTMVATAQQCAAFDASAMGASNATARWVDATTAVPAFCEVSGVVSPVQGSTINVVIRLPAQWNGKVLGIGGGGWAGNITLAAASEGLGKGYATMQTDGGNAGTDVWANSWVSERPESAIDFSHRAIHTMTVAGKAVAASFYGRPHSRAYYNGCSTGGRMGLMEAQRYPADYDIVTAGAPVYTLQTQTSAVFRNQAFAANNGAGAFTAEDLALVQGAVLAQCDTQDGLADGVVNDPASCNWRPSTLQCTGEKTATCLTAGQVTALQSVYDGRRASDGSWAMLPMRRGGEAGWSFFVGTNGTGVDPSRGGGLGGVYPVANPGREWNMLGMTEQDYLNVRRSPFAALYEARNPDLSAFFARGGRLMLWHGESDPGPSPVATLDYVQAVNAQNPAAAQQMRYFTLPGVGHCRGGPGADAVDYIAAMEQWDAGNTAPEQLIGRNGQSNIVRPHCAWPKVARYSGTGDADDPASWSCTARS
jgi:feruloyl esterase